MASRLRSELASPGESAPVAGVTAAASRSVGRDLDDAVEGAADGVEPELRPRIVTQLEAQPVADPLRDVVVGYGLGQGRLQRVGPGTGRIVLIRDAVVTAGSGLVILCLWVGLSPWPDHSESRLRGIS